jgi:hypothetical protein
VSTRRRGERGGAQAHVNAAAFLQRRLSPSPHAREGGHPGSGQGGVWWSLPLRPWKGSCVPPWIPACGDEEERVGTRRRGERGETLAHVNAAAAFLQRPPLPFSSCPRRRASRVGAGRGVVVTVSSAVERVVPPALDPCLRRHDEKRVGTRRRGGAQARVNVVAMILQRRLSPSPHAREGGHPGSGQGGGWWRRSFLPWRGSCLPPWIPACAGMRRRGGGAAGALRGSACHQADRTSSRPVTWRFPPPAPESA